LTGGQPWLVNALAYEVCFEMKEGRDRARPITVELIQQATEQLILRRDTHLDQLADKLREERVRRVIEPMLAGERLERQDIADDVQYVMDLGLIRRGAAGLEITNAIYREIIPRELTVVTQLNFESTQRPEWYIGADGRLEMAKLLEAFQQFFREHSEHWVERFDYSDLSPALCFHRRGARHVEGTPPGLQFFRTCTARSEKAGSGNRTCPERVGAVERT
jgi:hypothetical protein